MSLQSSTEACLHPSPPSLRYTNVAEAVFTRLLFQSTSFHCHGRPFHLVVTVLSAPPHLPPTAVSPAAVPAFPAPGGVYAAPYGEGGGVANIGANSMVLRTLACLCSSPVLVDARKRSK